MKCKENNGCKYNPKRAEKDSRTRSYIRQPIMEYEHEECPFRVDGTCKSPKKIADHIGSLRNKVKAKRQYLNYAKDKVELEYDDYLMRQLKKYFGGELHKTRDENRKERYLYKPEVELAGLTNNVDLAKWLDSNLEYFIKENLRPYGFENLFKRFRGVTVSKNKAIYLYGKESDFLKSGELDEKGVYLITNIKTNYYEITVFLAVGE